MWARNVNALLGVWLMAAHWILDYREPVAKFNEVLVGFGVIVVALLSGCVRPFHHLITLAGAWLVFSPLVLGYRESAPVVDSVVLGVLLVVSSLVPQHWRYYAHRHPSQQPR